MNGLPDPRDRLRRDMVNLYSRYIMGNTPTADVRKLGATVPGQAAVNWGEPEPVDDEDEEQSEADSDARPLPTSSTTFVEVAFRLSATRGLNKTQILPAAPQKSLKGKPRSCRHLLIIFYEYYIIIN